MRSKLNSCLTQRARKYTKKMDSASSTITSAIRLILSLSPLNNFISDIKHPLSALPIKAYAKRRRYLCSDILPGLKSEAS